ncbi:MAG TPA: hypothetical protein VK871_02545, partial [Candidatus Limnocylindrales bacterium]|nr:hypothetical protein [Candidatus Limnocylindrales bacterium]
VVGTPTAAPSPSAAVATITLDLVDVGGRQLTVEVVDQSGHLRSAAAMAGGWPGDVPAPQDVAATPVEGEPNQARIGWVGGACDAVTRFVIRPDGRTIEMATEPRAGDTPCILIGIFRGIVLTFDRRVEIADVEIVERSPEESAPSPSIDAAFPTQVLGLGVSSVGKALDLHPNFDNAELAIRGWYVSPGPTVDCPGLRDRIRPVRPPACAEGRHWLLDQPEDLWADLRDPGIDRQPTGRYLNPIIPSDVVFDVPDPWSGPLPDPAPVVIVGHFADPRITDTYAGIESFVVDQLVWAAGRDKPRVAVRLIDDMVESGADVLARVDRALGPGGPDWISLMRGSDLAILDPRVADSAPELTEESTVWVVRRLVSEEVGGIPRTVVDFAYTANGSDRVWTGNSCCALELATSIDVELPIVGTGRGTIQIQDYLGAVVAARMATTDEFSGWRPVGPAEGWWLEVAPGATPHELAIRWTADRCNTTWNLTVREGPWLDLTRPYVEGCETLNGIPRVIVLTFGQPIDVEAVTANDNTSGG